VVLPGEPLNGLKCSKAWLVLRYETFNLFFSGGLIQILNLSHHHAVLGYILIIQTPLSIMHAWIFAWLTVQWLQFQSLQQLLLQGILPGKHGTNTRQIPVANFTSGGMCNWEWNDTICWPLGPGRLCLKHHLLFYSYIPQKWAYNAYYSCIIPSFCIPQV